MEQDTTMDAATQKTVVDPQQWEDVSIRLLYMDGNKVKHREVRLNRAQIEAEERTAMGETPEDEEDFAFSPLQFKAYVFQAAQKLVTEPVVLTFGNENQHVRVLPPWATREVQITVNNLASRILS